MMDATEIHGNDNLWPSFHCERDEGFLARLSRNVNALK